MYCIAGHYLEVSEILATHLGESSTHHLSLELSIFMSGNHDYLCGTHQFYPTMTEFLKIIDFIGLADKNVNVQQKQHIFRPRCPIGKNDFHFFQKFVSIPHIGCHIIQNACSF